jgi:hypothetical protein
LERLGKDTRFLSRWKFRGRSDQPTEAECVDSIGVYRQHIARWLSPEEHWIRLGCPVWFKNSAERGYQAVEFGAGGNGRCFAPKLIDQPIGGDNPTGV